MKNDVVRWSAERNNNNKNNKNNYASTTTTTTSKWHEVEDSTTTGTSTRTLAKLPVPCGITTPLTPCGDADFVFTATTAAIKCDKNNSRKIIKNRKIRFLMHKHSPKHTSLAEQNRTNPKLNRTVSQFLCTALQLSAVVLFLCSLNINCASAAAAAAATTSSSTNKVSMMSVNANEFMLDKAIDVDDDDVAGHYTHTWAVHIPNGDDSELANEVAREHGFVNMGKIFDDHYHFAHHKVSKRSLSPASSHQTRLNDDQRVHWSQQQIAKSRSKRDFIRMRPSRTSSRAQSLVDAVPLSDPKWSQMWYLNRGGDLDMNVIPAWKEGITGKGIVVTILDDGLESDHPDIEHNYDPQASYDVNNHDDDPMPRYDMTDSNRHGTRCAGEVAATANNTICAVGIAYGASVGGVRMLDGDVTDAVEARSLSLNPQHIDIYSASWGPDDDGKTVDGPGELASRAFIEGVTKGRNGKGSIFIWASGNGGREMDNCNCDGYTNSIWTLSISSATEDGHVPWYSEKCSSTLATTYSSGGQSEKQVVTTDLHHSCTVSHTGTSASAPIAAGIAALVLESNPNLTWRDLQHIVVRTAKPANLNDKSWSYNGVGRRISHSFGYGLMDAAGMVKVARNWKKVPEQQRCEINAPHVDKFIEPMGYITLQLTVKHCLSVNYLEHVQAKITLTSQRRGDIQLILKSPAGTKVTLLTPRIHDVSRSGFNQWPFMSVHTWGESPHGNWQLEIHNEGQLRAQITQWDLIFYGTEIPAQPSDKAHKNPEQFNELPNNDIGEYDPSGQWRNTHMQQVGESNYLSNDKTNTACSKSTIDQKCLVCAMPTYLFNGRCYDFCPPQTYATTTTDANDGSLVGTAQSPTTLEDKDTGINTIATVDEELQATDRKKRQRRGRTIGKLIASVADDIQQRSCEWCDNTCLRCYGPLNSQCSTCFPGSQLHKESHTNETFCYVFAERSSGNSQEDGAVTITKINNATTTRSKNGAHFILLFFLFLMPCSLLIIAAILRLHKYRNSSNSNLNASYTALLADTDMETAADAAFITDSSIHPMGTTTRLTSAAMATSNGMRTLAIESTSESEEDDIWVRNSSKLFL